MTASFIILAILTAIALVGLAAMWLVFRHYFEER